MENFYQRHIPNMAAKACPLTDLTRHDKATGKPVPFMWSEECQQVFKEIKKKLSSTSLLHPPDWKKPFYLWTDTSLLVLGVCWNKRRLMANQLHVLVMLQAP